MTLKVNFPVNEKHCEFVKSLVGDAYVVMGEQTGIPHHHPHAHIERALAERMILNRLSGKQVVDIGGNAVR